jgi:hypothetical protein
MKSETETQVGPAEASVEQRNGQGNFKRLAGQVNWLTILAGSFLLFAVEPLAGKLVTAQFGGSSGIWSICLLFFQAALLLGYLVTLGLSKLSTRGQAISYAGLALASVLCLKVCPSSIWVPDANSNPLASLLEMLVARLALPCVFLSTISGTLQNWHRQMRLGDPYPLYAVSNAGSLAALLLYPLIIEPRFSLSSSLSYWTAGYWLVAILACVGAGLLVLANKEENSPDCQSASAAPPALLDYAWWVGLSALGCTILLSYTSYLTQDIAPVPLLWVVPLCLYLLTFIFCFGAERFYKRQLFLFLGPILAATEPHLQHYLSWNVLAVCASLFCLCMCCHGEIYRRRPEAQHLPNFYLAIAFGGMLGSMFVNLVAPFIFSTYAERIVAVVAAIVICFYLILRDNAFLMPLVPLNWVLMLSTCIACGTGVSSGLLHRQEIVSEARNFYGCVTVKSNEDEVTLVNGRIVHGRQNKNEDERDVPTTYYQRGGPVGFFDSLVRTKLNRPVKYAVIGLGAGTLAAYGQAQDQIDFYEIDPKIERIAQTYFTFLKDSPARINVKLGDARITLKNDPSGQYDLMIVDAFYGDAIPVHLLTKEAIQLYFKHLKPDGILLVHISNRYLDLEPVFGNLAKDLNLKCFILKSNRMVPYVALSKDPLFADQVGRMDVTQFDKLSVMPPETSPSCGIWSDDYSNIASILKIDWSFPIKLQ